MAEYIDKEAFKKSVEERYCKPCKAAKKDYNGCRCRACWVDDMLDEVECFQTADVAPVVRCKDCKHLVNETINANGFLICDISDMETAPDDFCSHGDRREEAGP